MAELDGLARSLAAELEQAERTVSDQVSPTNLFVQSLMIMLREGLEAILIIGALMAFLTRVGAGHRRRDITLGGRGAVGPPPPPAAPLEAGCALSPRHPEAPGEQVP